MRTIKPKLTRLSWEESSVWGGLLLGTAAVLAEHSILGFSGLLLVGGLLLIKGTSARKELSAGKKQVFYILITVVCLGVIVYMFFNHRNQDEKEKRLDSERNRVAAELLEITKKTSEDQSTLDAIVEQSKVLVRDQKSLIDTSNRVEKRTNDANLALDRAEHSISTIARQQAGFNEEERRIKEGIHEANRSLIRTTHGLSAIATETWRIQHPFLRTWNYTLKLAFRVSTELQAWVHEAITKHLGGTMSTRDETDYILSEDGEDSGKKFFFQKFNLPTYRFDIVNKKDERQISLYPGGLNRGFPFNKSRTIHDDIKQISVVCKGNTTTPIAVVITIQGELELFNITEELTNWVDLYGKQLEVISAFGGIPTRLYIWKFDAGYDDPIGSQYMHCVFQEKDFYNAQGEMQVASLLLTTDQLGKRPRSYLEAAGSLVR